MVSTGQKWFWLRAPFGPGLEHVASAVVSSSLNLTVLEKASGDSHAAQGVGILRLSSGKGRG